jgi:predicted RNA-binding Zn ribbon-like protein
MSFDGKKPTEPQPGGREPAPGRLALVQAFINSNYDLLEDHGAELLDSPAGLSDWLERRELPGGGARVTSTDLRRAIAVREGLRALLVAKHEQRDDAAIDSLNEVAIRLPVTVRLDADEPQFVAASDRVEAALGLVLSYAAAAMLDGTWSRLKTCRECRWAFYDHSRNGAGSWCSMAVCGSRVKQRAYHARHARS